MGGHSLIRPPSGALLGTLCRYCGGAGLWERELKTHLVHAIKATLKRDQKYLVQVGRGGAGMGV
jgi:hypothetical protein